MRKQSGQTNLLLLAFLIVGTALLSALLTRGLAPAQSDENIEQALTDFVIKNPTIIGNAVKQAYEIEQQKEEEKAKENIISKKDELHHDDNSPFVGNKNGSKVLVEFFDYNCGYCKKALPDIAALLENDKDLKVVLKEIPILGAMSKEASKISLAVFKNNPEKYWEFHTALLNSGARSPEILHSAVTNSGLDLKKIKEVAEGKDIADQLEKQVALAQAIGVRGTPAFVANTTLIRGAQGKGALKKALEQ